MGRWASDIGPGRAGPILRTKFGPKWALMGRQKTGPGWAKMGRAAAQSTDIVEMVGKCKFGIQGQPQIK